MSRAWECRRRSFYTLEYHCTFQDIEDSTYPLSCFGSDNGSQARSLGSLESSCVSDRSFVDFLATLPETTRMANS